MITWSKYGCFCSRYYIHVQCNNKGEQRRSVTSVSTDKGNKCFLITCQVAAIYILLARAVCIDTSCYEDTWEKECLAFLASYEKKGD
jgi:hypothetical protein